jgi:Icc-related predicted phosphoesterase
MKFVFCSDLHGFYTDIVTPECDTLIVAGDVLRHGIIDELDQFNTWLGAQPAKKKVWIAGNHDFVCQDLSAPTVQQLVPNGVYLEDSAIDLDGLKLYGSPWTPQFGNWAFMKERGKHMRDIWDSIPDDTDMLITHGPVAKILDLCPSGNNAGCADLKRRIADLRKKRLRQHIFGHIHMSNGVYKVDKMTFINCSTCNESYSPTQKIYEMEI